MYKQHVAKRAIFVVRKVHPPIFDTAGHIFDTLCVNRISPVFWRVKDRWGEYHAGLSHFLKLDTDEFVVKFGKGISVEPSEVFRAIRVANARTASAMHPVTIP